MLLPVLEAALRFESTVLFGAATAAAVWSGAVLSKYNERMRRANVTIECDDQMGPTATVRFGPKTS